MIDPITMPDPAPFAPMTQLPLSGGLTVTLTLALKSCPPMKAAPVEPLPPRVTPPVPMAFGLVPPFRVPFLTSTPPVKLLLPLRNNWPLPTLTMPRLPAVFWMVLKMVPEPSPLPTVRVAEPTAVLSTTPLTAPLRPLMVSEKPLRSSVPSIVTVPVPLPSGRTLAEPSFSVPAVTVTGAGPAMELLPCSV